MPIPPSPPPSSAYLTRPVVASTNGESWSHRSPRFGERAPASGDPAGLRSSDPKVERSPVYSYPRASTVGTVHSSQADATKQRLPPVSAIDPALADSHKSIAGIDGNITRPSPRIRASQEPGPTDVASVGGGHARSYSAREAAGLGRPIESLRSHFRAGHPGSSSSADWESTSDRGSPGPLSRTYAGTEESRFYAHRSNGQHLAPRISSMTPTHPSAYEDKFASAPATAASTPAISQRGSDSRAYPGEVYDEEHRPRRRGASPLLHGNAHLARPPKRKSSFGEAGPLPPPPQPSSSSRRMMYDPALPAGRGREWDEERASRDYYYDRAHPRSYTRAGGSPERSSAGGYPPAHEPHPYGPPARFSGEADVRYSPHRRGRSPQPPPFPSETYRSGRHFSQYDGPAVVGHAHADRRAGGGRYSPTTSPSYVSRTAAPALPPSVPRVPPPGAEYFPSNGQRGGGTNGESRPRSPSYVSDSRAYLPPPPGSILPSSAVYRDRYPRRSTPPPMELAGRRSSSPSLPPLSNEPFYPDRRFYYPRERIEDVEIDEYYHQGSSRSRHGTGGHPSHYGHAPPPQDAYGPPPPSNSSASFLPPPVSLGTHLPSARGQPMAIPLVVPPPPPPSSHRHHDPRHLGSHGGHDFDARHEMAPIRPHAVIGIPPPHIPPGPSTGIAPPPRRRGKLPKPVTDLLKSWLLDHASHPYPTEDEKRSLCSMTGLTLQQVSNWFINARRRILLPGSGGSVGGGATAEQVKAAFSQDSPSPPGSET